MNRRSPILTGCWLVAMLSVPAGAQPTMEWLPVGADGPHTINGNEIILDSADQRVTLEIRVSQWSTATGAPELATFQGTLDATTLLGSHPDNLANGTISGVDIQAVIGPPCGVDETNCGKTYGAYQVLEMCHEFDGVNFVPTGQRCDDVSPPLPDCQAGEFCLPNPYWIFASVPATSGVSTATANYNWAATVTSATCKVDDGVSLYYGGTLLVDVPAGARGTYTIRLVPTSSSSFLSQCNALPITPVQFVPAQISIACETSADCNDDNECTTDICDPDNTCANIPNYDAETFCCDPLTGDLTPLSDGIECTDDVCNVDGSVSHPFSAPGTDCGNPFNTECDNPDACDGAGNCLPNFAAPGTACGDQSVDTDCNGADTCDGSGVCLDNIQPAGASCGSTASSDCDDPDTCDGDGTCLPNHRPDGLVCDDGLFCNVGEACDGGACTGGSVRDCDDNKTCTADSCNESTSQCDNVLIAGNCLINDTCFANGELNPSNNCEECNTDTGPTDDWSLRPEGSECDDGDPCTGTGRPDIGVDECDATGTCVGLPDPECNDQCSFAIEAFEGANFSNNSAAGPDDGEASCQVDSNHDIWFFYTAACDGDVFVSTTGSSLTECDAGAPFCSNDSVLNVWDDCPDAGGVEIACDDDSGVGLHAALVFTATSGVSYPIRVAGFEDNRGDIVLNIAPVNDCVIAGVCYAEGERNPANECEMCIPDLSTSAWSPAPEGTACGDPSDTVCDSPDACDGNRVCESNPKDDGTLCPDDGNDCSLDFCEAGVCTHPPGPEGVPCDDQTETECDLPNTCDALGTCLDNYVEAGTACGDDTQTQCDNPDICDGAGACDPNYEPDGILCNDDSLCTGPDTCQTGECVGEPIPQPPTVTEAGPRSFLVMPEPNTSNVQVALLVTSPDWPCLSKYIGMDGTLSSTPTIQRTVFWATQPVIGLDIIPSTRYEVRAECEGSLTDVGTVTTCDWCDINCDGATNFADVQLIIFGFQGTLVTEPYEAVDIWPCEPDGVINFADVQRCILAFQGQTYAEAGCPVPCP